MYIVDVIFDNPVDQVYYHFRESLNMKIAAIISYFEVETNRNYESFIILTDHIGIPRVLRIQFSSDTQLERRRVKFSEIQEEIERICKIFLKICEKMLQKEVE